MYSWVPGAASSWTAVVPQQNEVGLESSPHTREIKENNNNSKEKARGRNTSKLKKYTTTAVALSNSTVVQNGREGGSGA